MNARKLLLPVLLVSAGGCASGGGGSGGSGPASDANRPPPPAPAEPSPCGTLYGRPVQCVPNQRTVIDERMRESEEQLRKMPVATFKSLYGYTPYWAASSSLSSMTSMPEPATDYAGDPKAVNPFTRQPGNAGVDSRGSGMQYHSFGVWNEHVGFRGGIMAWSHGQITPASAVPTSGNAKFTGQVVGLYVSSTGAGSAARADLTVDANFSTRTLGFASTNTTVQGAANAHLNLSGTLTYAPGQNGFAGTLRNTNGTLAGTSKGQFYGPQAQELGGAFRVGAGSGPEAFAGAYGAKRQ